MLKLPKRILLLISIAILTVLASLSYFYRDSLINYFKLKDSGSNIEVTPLDQQSFNYFPVDRTLNYTLGGTDRAFSAKIFQGIVVDYVTESNSEFVNVLYVDNKLQERTVKILLKLDKSKIPSNTKKLKEVSLDQKFINSYVDSISVTDNKPTDVDLDKSYLISVDNFKKAFPADTILTFKVFFEYPNKTEREKKYCDIGSYFYYCTLADISDQFETDLIRFWNGDDLGTNNVIVPIDIFTTIIEK